MRILSTRHQMFGNINKQLNQARARMNRGIKEECLEMLDKNKNRKI